LEAAATFVKGDSHLDIDPDLVVELRRDSKGLKLTGQEDEYLEYRASNNRAPPSKLLRRALQGDHDYPPGYPKSTEWEQSHWMDLELVQFAMEIVPGTKQYDFDEINAIADTMKVNSNWRWATKAQNQVTDRDNVREVQVAYHTKKPLNFNDWGTTKAQHWITYLKENAPVLPEDVADLLVDMMTYVHDKSGKALLTPADAKAIKATAGSKWTAAVKKAHDDDPDAEKDTDQVLAKLPAKKPTAKKVAAKKRIKKADAEADEVSHRREFRPSYGRRGGKVSVHVEVDA